MMALLSFEEIKNRWNNLSEVEQFEILGFASAVLTDNKQVPEQIKPLLNERLEKYDPEQTTNWGQLYNKLIKELI